MAEQPELSAEAAAPVEPAGPTPEERLAAAAAEHPEDRCILMCDTRTRISFVLRIPPTSPWHELLPATQISFIRPGTTAQP